MISHVKTDRRVINGIQFQVTQLPAVRSLKLMSRLGKVAGPSIGQLSMLSLQADASQAIPALTAVFDRITDAELESLLIEIFSTATAVIDDKQIPLGSKEMINSVFSGKNFPTMFLAVQFALEVNYGDFFDVLLSALASAEAAREAREAEEEESKSSSDSTTT